MEDAAARVVDPRDTAQLGSLLTYHLDRLRSDPRVRVLERTNARALKPAMLPAPATAQAPMKEKPATTAQAPVKEKPATTAQAPVKEKPATTAQAPAKEKPAVTAQAPASGSAMLIGYGGTGTTL